MMITVEFSDDVKYAHVILLTDYVTMLYTLRYHIIKERSRAFFHFVGKKVSSRRRIFRFCVVFFLTLTHSFPCSIVAYFSIKRNIWQAYLSCRVRTEDELYILLRYGKHSVSSRGGSMSGVCQERSEE